MLTCFQPYYQVFFFQHPQNEGMEHLTKIVGEYLTEPNSKVKAEDLVWTELDISISQKIMTGLSCQFLL